MTRNKYANRGKVAGILVLVYGAILVITGLISLFGGNALGGVVNLLVALGMIFWGVTLAMGKRDSLPVVGAAVLTLMQLISQIIQLAGTYIGISNIISVLLWMAVFVLLTLVMAGGLLPRMDGLRKTAKSIWFLPAILMGVYDLLTLIGMIVLIGRYGRYMSGAEIVGSLIGTVIGTVAWLITLIYSCQWAALGEETQQAALPRYQNFQQPQQFQGYQQSQYPNYQQPQQYQGYQQPQYPNYQQPQQFQGYQQPQQPQQPQQFQDYQQPQQPAEPADGSSEG